MQLTPIRVAFATIASVMCMGVAFGQVDVDADPAWILVGAVLAAVPWLYILILSAPSTELKAFQLRSASELTLLGRLAANPISKPSTISEPQTSMLPHRPMSESAVGSRPEAAELQPPLICPINTKIFTAVPDDPAARKAPISSALLELSTALPSAPKSLLPETPSSRKTRSPPHVLKDAAYYARHRGVPGYLYMARNDSHVEGAFKLGYTTVLPIQRIEKLSQQCSQQARDVGAFRLVHAIPVSDSYDMEQMLFHALVSRRIEVSKEFFFGSADGLCGALEAAHAADRAGSVTPLLEYLQSADLGEDRVESERPNLSIGRAGTRPSQFVAICRNRFHEVGIHKLVGGARLARIVDNLNDRQRECTSQLGEYDVVHIQAVLNAKLVLRDFSARNAELRVRPNQDFYRAPLPTLLSLLADLIARVDRVSPVVSKRSPLVDAEERDLPRGESTRPPIACTVIHGDPSASWAPWAIACLCGSRLRVLAAIGEQGEIECPSCRRTRSCRQGAEALRCLGPWSDESLGH
jgi:hypothetical protein